MMTHWNKFARPVSRSGIFVGAKISRPLTGVNRKQWVIYCSTNYVLKSCSVTGVEGERGAAWHSGNIMSPVLSKEGKSDGSWYKKIEKYERHEESGLSRYLFPLDETGSVHLSHLPFFRLPLKKAQLYPLCLPFSRLASLPLSLSFPLSLFLSLVSSDTLVSLRVEEQRDSAMGLLEEMERRREEKWGGESERESGEERRRRRKKRGGGWLVRKREKEPVHPNVKEKSQWITFYHCSGL